jgi:hypothetical protein
MGGPFEILSRPYWLKAVDRKAPLCGEQVVPVQVIAGMGDSLMPVEGIADGQGLIQRDADRFLEHDVDPNHMRVTPEGTKVDYLEFDLGRAVALDLMQVWNYNETDKTQWGLRRADIAVWTEGGTWQKVKPGVLFNEAQGTEDYDEPTLVPLGGVQAAKVRLENLVGFEGSNRMGLSEVQFFQVRPAKAIKPQPTHEGAVSDLANASLRWTPGKEAVQQRIYMGLDPNDLKCLGEVKADVMDVRLSPLTSGSRYLWRIDTVQSDGSVEAGDLWSFKTGLVGWWKLDEAEGMVASDSSGNHYDGKLVGNPQWQPTGGKVGGALKFGGVEDYMELPEAVGTVAGDFTVAVWAYPTAAKSWSRLIDLGNANDDDNIIFGRLSTTKDIFLEVYDGTSTPGKICSSNGEFDLNQWQFFAATLDEEGDVTVYKNGDLIVTGRGAIPRDLPRRSNYVGKSHWPADEYYEGLMDDLRIYDVSLSKEEVKALYEGHPMGGPVQPAMLPHILSAAEAAQAEPIEADQEAPAGETTPGQETRRMLAMGPLMLVLVVVVVGILGIVFLSGRKKE